MDVRTDDVRAEDLGAGQYRVKVSRSNSDIAIRVSFDKLEAEIEHLTLPSGDALPPTREWVIAALEEVGVTKGLLFEEIDRVLTQVITQHVQVRNVVVARGKRALPSEEGTGVYHYLRPTADDAERRQRIVREGELLIERRGVKPGAPGFTVTGEVIPVPSAGSASGIVGTGITCDETETGWVANVIGFGFLEYDADGVPSITRGITLSDDRMHAYVHLCAPTADEEPLTRAEVDAALTAAGVVHGLLPERLDAAWTVFAARGCLPRPVRVADGTPSVPGRDASIEFALEVEQVAGTLDIETGRIDYRERNAVRNVEAGQVLGVWHPAEPGEAGTTVDGETVPPQSGREGTLTAEANVATESQEDGTIVLAATKPGIVVAKPGHIVAVVDLLEVPGDVDFSIGNFHARGVVDIRGTVRTGFRVTGEYDIAVHECIEDAVVKAGNDLLVIQGIIGGDDSSVHAGGRITTTFVQAARVSCDGDIEVGDAATNSIIECGGKLTAMNGHGRIVGGRCTAAAGVLARVLGSELGTRTVVAVGENPAAAKELRTLRSELEAALEERGTADRAVTAAVERLQRGAVKREQALALRALKETQRELHERCEDLVAKELVLKDRVHQGTPPRVEVLDIVYPGVDVFIWGCRYKVNDAMREVRFKLNRRTREVQIEPL